MSYASSIFRMESGFQFEEGLTDVVATDTTHNLMELAKLAIFAACAGGITLAIIQLSTP